MLDAAPAARRLLVLDGDRHTVGDMARTLAGTFGGPEPMVTGEVSFVGDGMHEFATAPLRPAP